MSDVVLTDEQLARAEALKAAGNVLRECQPTTDISAVDMVSLASWILDGKDPYETSPSTSPDSWRSPA